MLRAVQEWDFQNRCECGHSRLDHSHRANPTHSPCWECNDPSKCQSFRPSIYPASQRP